MFGRICGRRTSMGEDMKQRSLLPKSDDPMDKMDPEAQSLLAGDGEGHRNRTLGLPTELVSGFLYCTASVSMVILNKLVLSSFDFSGPNALLLFQCFLAVVLALLCHALGFCKIQPLRWDIVKLWLPANIVFVGMLGTSFYALSALGVAMVTVLKNLSNLFTITGDYFFFGKTYCYKVWLALALIMISAVMGGMSDLSFSWVGYTWQIINCCFTAAYSLYLRNVMTKVSKLTASQPLGEVDKVLYNNLLSLPLVAVLMVAFGEYPGVLRQEALYSPSFQIAAVASGVVGFCISFCSLWFLSSTTATAYSLVGSLNKIPVAVLGILLFATPMNVTNGISISIGLLAGVLFVWSKLQT